MISYPKEHCRVSSLISIERNRAKRNAAIFFALISGIVIYWQNWNRWSFILPVVLSLYVIIKQINITLLKKKLKRFTLNDQNTNEGCEDTVYNEVDDSVNDDALDAIEDKLKRIERRLAEPINEIEKKALLEELASLRLVLDARQHNREAKVEEIRVELENNLNRSKSDDERHVLPTFREWFASVENRTFDKDEALMLYIDNLEKIYREELAQNWFKNQKGLSNETQDRQ